MEWIGFFALIVILCYSSYPGKVRRLELKVKRLERKLRGENDMSKLLSELVNKQCKIKTEDAIQVAVSCQVIDVDDEWVKVSFTDKKQNITTKLLRIENIQEVEVLDHQEEQ